MSAIVATAARYGWAGGWVGRWLEHSASSKTKTTRTIPEDYQIKALRSLKAKQSRPTATERTQATAKITFDNPITSIRITNTQNAWSGGANVT